MNRWPLALSALPMLLTSVATARSLNLVAEVGLGAGTVSHSAGTDQPLLPSVTLTVGLRLVRLRAGMVGRLANSLHRGAMLETGLALSYDFWAVEVDAQRTAGFYFRCELLARAEPDLDPTPEVAWPLAAAVGLRVLGVSLQVGGGAVWEPSVPERKWGWLFEARLAFDLMELPDLISVVRVAE